LGEASSWLFIVTCAPYQHGLDSDPAIDTLMAAGAFGQDVAVLFMDDGLKYLDADLAAAEGQSDLRKLLKSLPLYDVERVHVLTRGTPEATSAFSLPVDVISKRDALDLIASVDHVVTY
jgi:sulfur relay (sulfurtransferase) DsrF/TusC family protein